MGEAPGAQGLKIGWGILGTGAIARRFASELQDSRHGRLVAVGSRETATAEAFAAAHAVDRALGSYDALLDDDGVEVVYVSTPHPFHAEWAIRAAEAGKHVLCEKPLTVHATDAERVIDAARAAGVFLMEAFMYRCHPLTGAWRSMIDEGVVGEVRVVEAVHSFRGSADPAGRLLANELGGGAILDVGCYCMSGARLATGEEPDVVTGAAHVGSTGVDEWAVASLGFPAGAVAHLATGVQVDQPPVLRVHGTEGSLSVPAPWLPGIDGARVTEVIVERRGEGRRTVEVRADRGLYAIEADHVAECVAAGAVESPAMRWADTLGNLRALDRWRQAVGVSYAGEPGP